MDLPQIAVFCAFAVFYLLLLPSRWRGWALLVGSIIAIYWLQPVLAVRWLDYSLTTATLTLTVVLWFFTRPKDPETGHYPPLTRRRIRRLSRDDGLTLVVIVMLALFMTASRYVDFPVTLTGRPPQTPSVLLTLVIIALTVAALLRIVRKQAVLLNLALLGLIVTFIVIKTEPLTVLLAGLLRGGTGQDTALAAVTDVGWLGFSYVAFRLIHTVRDRQSGLLPDLSLREYVTYVIFFPAYTAGPIDRAERFITDYRPLAERVLLEPSRLTEGIGRILTGLFKKFVIADSLALWSLSADSAGQIQHTGGMWIALYTYAFRLFFDFSGYSDIAIGTGILFGIKLPENFDRPYMKQNIAAFWQSWHITLSNWARFYVYSPISRHFLRRKPPLDDRLVVALGSLATMIVIGLWHGLTLPFFIWGVWHGLGLFVHKWWTDRTRKWYRNTGKQHPQRKRAVDLAAWALTFHFVVLGWVWFVLPDINAALRVFWVLFGFGGAL